jgi:hypothetical protein
LFNDQQVLFCAQNGKDVDGGINVEIMRSMVITEVVIGAKGSIIVVSIAINLDCFVHI